jgi:hypothetical protein
MSVLSFFSSLPRAYKEGYKQKKGLPSFIFLKFVPLPYHLCRYSTVPCVFPYLLLQTLLQIPLSSAV